MEEKKYDSAKILLDTSLVFARLNKDLSLQASLYDTYSDLYKDQGDFKTSLQFLRKSIRKRAAFKKQQQIQTSLFLSAVFETQKKEKELLIQEAKLSRYKVYFLAAAIVILLLIAIVIYFRQKVSLDRIRMENMQKAKSLEIADAMIKGQDEERKRLAMDLHDGLGARLGALRLKVDTVLYENPHYYDIYSAIDGIARNVRELSHRMLPARLSEIGLIQSLQNLIKSVNASSEMKIDFQTNVKNKLEDKFQVNLYYLIYELINNAIKHSKGNNLTIQLFLDKKMLTLSAEDDGVGFDITKKGEGHGLNNIRQRVDYLGGKLIIESQEGYGSAFMIEIPMV
jgi:signal transduction histidine kinase